MEEEHDHAAVTDQANEVGERPHIRSGHVSFRFCFQSADLRNTKLRQKSGVYQKRLEQFFVANGISPVDKNRKRAILLNSCGKQTYHLLRSLVGPSKSADTPYKKVCKMLQSSSNSDSPEIHNQHTHPTVTGRCIYVCCKAARTSRVL